MNVVVTVPLTTCTSPSTLLRTGRLALKDKTSEVSENLGGLNASLLTVWSAP